MDQYRNAVRVAAHRGNSKYYPENTLVSFRSALKLPVDQIEIDLHMTKDHEIIMMHDHKVDRTTDGEGLIREKTLKEMKALDAGSWKCEAFKGERVPLFEEFLELLKGYPDMTVNVELKDYPDGDDPSWARESADRSIALLEKYGMGKKIWINCFSAELLEYIDEKYGHAYRLHGYFPHSRMHGKWSRDPYDYLHCVCLFGTKEEPVVEKKYFDEAKARGVEPWCYFPNDEHTSFQGAIANGCMLLTTNDPAGTLEYLRIRGLHE